MIMHLKEISHILIRISLSLVIIQNVNSSTESIDKPFKMGHVTCLDGGRIVYDADITAFTFLANDLYQVLDYTSQKMIRVSGRCSFKASSDDGDGRIEYEQ